MKKNALKITLFVLCVAVAVFLLLPFLEKSNSDTASLNVKAEPQIFTSNPLTALMNRLASLFGRPIKEKPATVLTAKQVDQMFGKQVPANNSPMAAAPISKNTAQPTQEGSSWEQPTRVDMSDALVLNEEGNWVLARQVYPENSPQGMHEINIKDNSYDSYIRQQKAAQYNPALQQPETSAPTAEPESYWQKLIAPIKHFFGFDEAQAVTPGEFQQMAGGAQDATAIAAGSINGTNWNQAGNASTLAKAPSPDFSLDVPDWLSTPMGKEKIRQQMRDLYRLFNPEALLEHAVDTLANSKFPEPLTDKQRQQKQEFAKETAERLVNELKEWQRARMGQYYTNQSALENFKGACQNEALPNSQACFPYGIPNLPDEEIQKTQMLNQQIFQNITHVSLPHVPFTPVLGMANKPLSLAGEKNTFNGADAEGLEITNEIYDWQFKHHGCDKQENSCFYVANGIQKDPGLKETIQMTTGFFQGDPAHVYQQDKPAFINHRLEQLPADTPDPIRQKVAEKAAKDYEKFAPPHVVYTADVGREYQQKMAKTMADPHSNEDVSFLLMLNGSQASDLEKAINSPAFLYDSNSEILGKTVSPQLLSNSVVESSARLAKESYEHAAELTQELNKESIKNKIGDGINLYNQTVAENGGNALQAFHQLFAAPPPDKK